MRAALFHEFGGIDKIVVEDVETPKPLPNEVLIKVGACALNHLDVDFREGISRFPVDPGGVFGLELAGEIVEVPDGILFPILAAHACFIKKDSKGKWVMTVPEKADKDLIEAAKAVYQSMANSDPNKMGKSKDCYSLLAVMSRNKNS
jgi:hypothetical protein